MWAGLRIASLVGMAVLMGACNSGGGNSDDDNSNDSNTGAAPFTDPAGADLSSVTLAASEAAPMEWVEILGLPEGIGQEDVHVKYLPKAFDEAPWSSEKVLIMPLYIEHSEDSDSVFLAAPLLELDGATAKMVVSDGKSHSGLLDLKLLALPARRVGAIDELTVAMEDLLKAGTEALGKSYPQEWEDWRDQGYNQIPEYLLPLALFWHDTVNPNNPNALTNRSYNEEERELLERILAHPNRQGRLLVETVENLAQATRDGDTLLDEAADTTPVMNSTAPTLPKKRMTRRGLTPLAASSPANRELNGQHFVSINGPDALAVQLQAFKDARELSEDIEMATDIAEIGATVLTVAIPGGGAANVGARLVGKSATKRATAFVVTSTARLAGYSQMSQWFLPCCIPDMQVEIDPADGRVMFEDEPDNQISLVSATGRVESAGVDLVQEAFDMALGKIQGQFDEVSGTVIDELVGPIPLSDLESELIPDDSDPLFQAISDRFPGGANLVLVWEDIDLIGVEPQRWLNHETDTFASAGSPIIEQGSTASHQYEFKLRTPEAFDRQSSLLRFRTNTDELPAPEAIHTLEVGLEYVDLQFEPSVIRVDEDSQDQPVAVTLTVTHAHDTEIELPLQLDPDFGTIVQTGTENDGVYTFEYTPPAGDLPSGGIAEVPAKSIAQTGIRTPGNNPPPRIANLLIAPKAQPVDIVPRATCLSSGETQQFQALDPLSREPVDVTWSASRGSISDSGLYTASGGNGQATVTASTETHSSSAQIAIGDCSCSFTASVSGGSVGASDSFFGAQGGVVLSLGESGYDGIQFFGEGEAASNMTALMWTFETPLAFGATGPGSTSIRAHVGSILRGEGFSSTDMGTGTLLPPLEVTITRRQPLGYGHTNAVSMAGTITGTVSVSNLPEDPVSASLDITFDGLFTYSPPSNTLNCDNISF